MPMASDGRVEGNDREPKWRPAEHHAHEAPWLRQRVECSEDRSTALESHTIRHPPDRSIDLSLGEADSTWPSDGL
jgi:hypothetical protein